MDIGAWRLQSTGSQRVRRDGSDLPCMHLCIYCVVWVCSDFPGGSDGKPSVYNTGDLSSIPGSRRFPGEENGNPLQDSCLKKSMDGGAWCRLLSIGSQRVGVTERPHFLLSFLCVLSCVQLFVTLWIAAHQAPLSMQFSRQEYWSGLLCPPPVNRPNPGIEEPASLMSSALAGRFLTTSTTWETI